MLIALILAAAAATTPPAGAAQTTTTAAAGATASAAPGSVPVPNAQADKLVCKRYEETGSRTNTRKVCLTRAQWAEQEEGGKAFADAMRAQARATQ